ncbi:N-acetylglucosamine-6-phosphate deacetylase [Amphibacillus sediminis]|uniref:N-acetylglucosamine-6-phosphate deacetylase n=1 Tax=Amphibacillus sediminis TaxID=360185 RepID=UPI00082F94C5|nr:N-acetylglucosamine-6-phosphate deacetylase [Amphibacillus sediminis]
MSVTIAPERLLYNGSFIVNHVLEIENGIITHVLPRDQRNKVDYTYNGLLIPGLIDTHIHGHYGVEVIDASVEELVAMKENLLKCGVTSFLPTLQTDEPERIITAIRNILEARRHAGGANIIGIFLEGPFLSEKFKGAQDGRFLRLPAKELLEKWQQAADGLIKKIAIAPELAGAMELIKYAHEQGIVVAIGHSNASADIAEEAINHGASVAVHTFNAMRNLHHREPGILGESLVNDKLYAELICDGYHLNPKIVDLIIRAKGVGHTILITDGTTASGLPDGDYTRSKLPIQVKGGAVRTMNGTLAGSSLTLLQAIRNIVRWEKVSLEEAIQMATLNPAKTLGLDTKIGSLIEGARADFVVLDDDFQILSRWVDGKESR